jgi:HEAT repeat-containing protein 5
VLVLAGLIPALADTPVSARLESSEEAVGLVRIALQALVDVSEVFPSIIKTDLHATILHIFVTILGTGVCQAAVVPQALPIFRRFVVSVVADDRSETRGQLQNTLSRMMVVLKNAQKRETAASLPCEKNTLLAITILLSAAPTELPETNPTVMRFAAELGDCLDHPMTCRVAAGCIRTLLSAGVTAEVLLTKAITFLTTPTDLEGMDEAKTVMAQTLSIYAAKLSSEQRSAAVALFIYALQERAALDGDNVHRETASRLLELANADNAAFRGVVAGMDDTRRRNLEQIVKTGAGAKNRNDNYGADHEPTIALKMNFGPA